MEFFILKWLIYKLYILLLCSTKLFFIFIFVDVVCSIVCYWIYRIIILICSWKSSCIVLFERERCMFYPLLMKEVSDIPSIIFLQLEPNLEP